MKIVAAETPGHHEDAAALFSEYAEIPGIEACIESLDQEVSSLPGEYVPPAGALLLAYSGNEPAGCVAIGRLDESTCEMRRLFVRSVFRGTKIGRSLAEAALREAARLGYRTMRLETLPARMRKAVALYKSMGFKEIEPYGARPAPEALHLEKSLP